MTDKKEPKISAVVHTYNAAKHLDKCLAALHGFDEILVIDMESTDDTVEIARRHGARVEIVERGEHRIKEAYMNYGIQAASHEWIIDVDADEIVPPALRDFLYDEIRRDPSPRAYLIPIKNYFMGRWMSCYYPDYILRFFYREGADWPYKIHSRVKHQGPVVTIDKKRTDLAYIHLANDSVHDILAKMNNYSDNEVERRRSRYSRLQLLYAPFYRFFKTYVLKGGFRDGMPGFIHAVHDAIYRFAVLAKIEEERQNAKPGKDIEKDVEKLMK